MVCGRAKKQQVPHRAFSPVRNDILIYFFFNLLNCANVGFAQAARDRCCGNFNSPTPKILSFRRALKAREEPAVLWSGNGLWSSEETAGSSPGLQPGSE
jgi:hypothetical protein